MLPTKTEFAVQLQCEKCVETIKNCLLNMKNIKSFDISMETDTVIVESTLPIFEIEDQIKATGRKVVIKGYAGSEAGVAIFENTGAGNTPIQGVVRFVQASPTACIVDGTVDGLEATKTYKLAIHEFGDISRGCASIGDEYKCTFSTSFQSSENGRANFRLQESSIQLKEVIGRSLVLNRIDTKKEKNIPLVCGVIARSAGLFKNPKTICACDGVTIWNEKVTTKAAL